MIPKTTLWHTSFHAPSTHHRTCRTKTDAYIHYIDFKGAFPFQDHLLLTRTLTFLGFPTDFVSLINNLYTSATTIFLTPYGPTPPIRIQRGTLQGDPLSSLLFDFGVEPVIK